MTGDKTSMNLRERKTTISEEEGTKDENGATATATTASGTSAAGQTKKKKCPCGKCEEEVTTNSRALQCQVCETWFHSNCIPGMTKDFFDNCKAARDTFGSSAFLCHVCRKVVSKFNRAMKDIEAEVEKLKERVVVLEMEKETLAQKIENMELKTTKVKEGLEGVEKEVVSGMEKAKEEVKKDVNKEMKEREERSQNLVIYGIEEAASGTAEEKKENDKRKVEEVMKEIGVEGEMEIKFRAGKRSEEPNPRPRPLIISLKSDECRALMLRNARKLARNPSLKSVYIATDMTWAQREEARKIEKELREEAERKTEEAKKEGKNGKFVVVGPRERRRMIWTERVD